MNHLNRKKSTGSKISIKSNPKFTIPFISIESTDKSKIGSRKSQEFVSSPKNSSDLNLKNIQSCNSSVINMNYPKIQPQNFEIRTNLNQIIEKFMNSNFLLSQIKC